MAKKSTSHSETATRSLVKSISYRIVIIISVFITVLFNTNDYDATFRITAIAAVTGTILYYIHERVWSLIRWGRK